MNLIDYEEYKRCLNNRDSEGLKDWAVHEIYLDIADSLAKIAEQGKPKVRIPIGLIFVRKSIYYFGLALL